ncbi:MAG: glycosyltransferase family 4 protein [Candidatus Pseudobacter hemicellulosilyticus]|uniref:Glycosyltransferase family 4 protein n=1 Tax=Candidatus Pseudobacter hemicellulosilyticus TaxID=3121375 RepID=A0AAJ6BE97_9BACT|nr:MAG: glycosyltransferase family 4 protein [Pseudobacter sp.]
MKHLVFTVTNDLSYDQRMIRICSSLANAGYRVTLVGCRQRHSLPLEQRSFRQRRLHCFFRKGKLWYAEYNFRLFWYLLFIRMNLICAIDLDTIFPCYWVSRLKRIPRVYDAHELFCEMKEVATRPAIHRAWKWVEHHTVPYFLQGYTVNELIAMEFRRMYGVKYEVVRNVPIARPLEIPAKPEKFILYQGAVNEGRCFETLIPAMKQVDARLIVCGDGNFMEQALDLVRTHHLEEKIIFEGRILPEALRAYTEKAWVGITLCDREGLSIYYSLANRFFDYLQCGVPQLCVDFPVYRELNNQYQIAVLIDDLGADSIARELNNLLNDEQLYGLLQQNCLTAREIFTWQEEEKKLIAFYRNII